MATSSDSPPTPQQMTLLRQTHRPLVDWGMASLVLGTIGLMLFIFPILGVPIAAFALFFGIVGTAYGVIRSGPELRWSLGGLAMSALALAANIAINYPPSEYFSGRWGRTSGPPVSDETYVPPPAKPNWDVK